MQQQAILYSNSDFIVVNKPAGISVQCEQEQAGCIARLRELTGESTLHPVHRLDKGTSGLLLVAKNAEANKALSRLFQSRTIEKYYYALCSRRPRKKQGAVIGDMKPARNGAWKLLKSHENPAITQFFSAGLGDGLRLVTVKPFSGKTHQIRVALKSLGAPILGDVQYGGEDSDRLYLHAAALKFTYNQKPFSFFHLPDSGNVFLSKQVAHYFEQHVHPSELSWPPLKK